MRGLCLACFVLCGGLVAAQEAPESTTVINTESTTVATTESITVPAAIVKQINEINEDGSYTVGYEASDGSFKLETRDTHGNVEGKYGFIDDSGEIKIVQYSANNITGFTTDLSGPVDNSVAPVALAAPVVVDPAFALEQERHNAVLAHQKNVVERQQQIAQQRELDAQRQTFANQQGAAPRRPVFNAANFNPQQPAAGQFNQQNFNQNFQQFQQQQQFPQQPHRFSPQQTGQFQSQFGQPAFEQPRSSPFGQQQLASRFQPQQPAFSQTQAPQFRAPQPVAPQASQLSQAQLSQLFAQSAPTQQQQFSPQQQQFLPQQQQFVPQQQQFAPQQQFSPQQFASQPQFFGQ